jgi:isocitrate dehydrogenase (NAD+)
MFALRRLSGNSFLFSAQKQKVVLFPGNGIGPEISRSVEDIFAALKIPIEFEHHAIHTKGQTEQGDLISNDSIAAVQRYKYGLKGPFETPIGKGFRSLNVTLRKRLQLFANVRPCRSIEGVNTPYKNVDLVTIRENTEGEYSGLEHEVVPGVVENLKIISRTACENITKYAFEYAVANGRKSIVACHKAGVMQMGDGLFIKTAEKVAKGYPSIEYWEEQIDTVCMQLANNPNDFDVMVMPNLYGDIVSDLCAGLIGGLGLTASGNIGFDCEVYEAVHGTAPDIAGQNKANPTALILSATMMLKSMKMNNYAVSIENSVMKVMREGKFMTGDLGGKAKTTEFTQAVIDNLVI